MKTNIKKLICGFLAAGTLLVMVGTANAEYCLVNGKMSRVNSYDQHPNPEVGPKVTYFLVRTTINGTEFNYTGFTMSDNIVNTVVGALTNGMNVGMSSNNCEPPMLVNGEHYRFMGKIYRVGLSEVKKFQPVVSK